MPNPKKLTIDDLATLIKTGFDSVDERFDQVEGRLKKLEQGQENIELRLSNVAYRFELRDLEHRVTVLEKKNNIKAKK
jgi:hypothetical protein